MKELDYTERTAKWTDADGDEHEHSVSAATVTASNLYIRELNERGEVVTLPRQVTTRDGNAHMLRVGEVVVQTERPGVVDVMTADAWATTGYSGADVTPPVALAQPAEVPVSEVVNTPVVSTDLTDIKALLTEVLAQQTQPQTQTAPAASDVHDGPDLTNTAESDTSTAQHADASA